MKNLYLLIAMFCASLMLAQNENNHWQLGKSDVNFTNDPGSATTVSAITGSNYGCASVSDQNGNLLFYTDGIYIWNKNHQIILHGQIDHAGSSTQQKRGIVIVPYPGDSNKYYVISNRVLLYFGNMVTYDNSVYSYSLVDFTNNSLGEMVILNPSLGEYFSDDETKYVSFLKKVNGEQVLHKQYYEPITYTYDNSGNNFWVIVQGLNSLYSYKIDDNGLNVTPVVSNFSAGTIYNYYQLMDTGMGINNATFRIVPDYNSSGYKLYGLEWASQNNPGDDPIFFNHHFYSVSFNNITGAFTGYQNIPLSTNGGNAQSFEFSNDYEKVYFVKTQGVNYAGTTVDGEIRVLNLATNVERTLYEYASPTTISASFLNIQKDKYDNLLLTGKAGALNRDKYLHKIDNPDSYTGATVITNHITLNGNTAKLLPQSVLHYEQPCSGSLLFTSTETAVNKIYKSSGTIETNTNYVINSGSTITFKSDEAIYLNPNSDIKSGSVFVAEIVTCPAGRPSSARMGNSGEDEQIILSSATKLYPNPNNGTFEISLANTVQGAVSIQVVDITGKIVYANSFDTAVLQVDIPNLTTGIYLVKLSGNNYNETIKFIKQ